MDLPKNVTQIGEINSRFKIYVEDYVVSYLKQQNREAGDKKILIALYGCRKKEDDSVYVFIYGAARTEWDLEIDRSNLVESREYLANMGKRYFQGWELLGFKELDGEPVEDFKIYEGSRVLQIRGYVQFYEKNEDMLSYMIRQNKQKEQDKKIEEKYEDPAKLEIVNREKISNKIKSKDSDEGKATKKGLRAVLQLGFVAAAFAVYININNNLNPEKTISIETLSNNITNKDLRDVTENVKNSADSLFEKLQEKINNMLDNLFGGEGEGIKTAQDYGGQNETGQIENEQTEVEQIEKNNAVSEIRSKDKLIIDEEFERVLQEENGANEEATDKSEAEQIEASANIVHDAEDESKVSAKINKEEDDLIENENPESSSNVENQENIDNSKPAGETHIVDKGESLSLICVKKYGDLTRLREICEINNISDSDNIFVGQKIFLP